MTLPLLYAKTLVFIYCKIKYSDKNIPTLLNDWNLNYWKIFSDVAIFS